MKNPKETINRSYDFLQRSFPKALAYRVNIKNSTALRTMNNWKLTFKKLYLAKEPEKI